MGDYWGRELDAPGGGATGVVPCVAELLVDCGREFPPDRRKEGGYREVYVPEQRLPFMEKHDRKRFVGRIYVVVGWGVGAGTSAGALGVCRSMAARRRRRGDTGVGVGVIISVSTLVMMAGTEDGRTA